MAFDGITIAHIVSELNHTIVGGKINKIAQPEGDELLITVKNQRTQYRLLLSASASLPLIYLTENNKPSPLTAPNFCMLLRKHIGSARILSVTQPAMERVIQIRLEHLNELGDVCRKYLMIEIMGKHSNIIFCDEDLKILDSIKHVSSHMSSVREVLPGRDYFIPETQEKENPLTITQETFFEKVLGKPFPIFKAIYSSLTGISPLIAEEICHRASIDGGMATDSLKDIEKIHLFHTFRLMMDDIENENFSASIIFKGKEPVEFASMELTMYHDLRKEDFSSVSKMLEYYYRTKSIVTRIRQKSAELRKVTTTALERSNRKLLLQRKQMKDTEKKEKYRIYGELINTYGYTAEPGSKSFKAINYYNGEEVTVPLDPTMTLSENANKYFDRYNKLKRTGDALQGQLEETQNEIAQLESIMTALDIAMAEEDLVQLKQELTDFGYIKRKGPRGKQAKVTSKPFHYLSSDGFDIYVGKNNYQNEEVTFKIANGGDWWFHAKGRPGSHVIVRTGGRELPDRVYEEAGQLAAYYSSGKDAPKVEIDYTQRKNLRKANGGAPGFVIYHTNYSMMATPDISSLQLADK